MNFLAVAKIALKGAGALTGVLGKKDSGEPVRGRKARLVATGTALLVALLSWAGLPPEIAQAAADFAVAVGMEVAKVDSLP